MKRLLSIALFAVILISCTSNSKKILAERELKVGECIETEWGQCSLEESGKDGFLYLEINNWPEKGLIVVPGLNTRVYDIYLKAKPKYHFAWRFHEGNLEIHTSSFKGEAESDILVVKTKGKVTITEYQKEDTEV